MPGLLAGIKSEPTLPSGPDQGSRSTTKERRLDGFDRLKAGGLSNGCVLETLTVR
jgi:hypothetical protein